LLTLPSQFIPASKQHSSASIFNHTHVGQQASSASAVAAVQVAEQSSSHQHFSPSMHSFIGRQHSSTSSAGQAKHHGVQG